MVEVSESLWSKAVVAHVETQREAIARYASLLRQCARDCNIARGKVLHSKLVSDGLGNTTFLQNLLVDMYGRCGSLATAVSVFEKIESPSVFSWTLIVSANALNGDLETALEFTCRMLQSGVKPDEAAFVAVMSVVSGLEDCGVSRRVHAWAVEAGYASDLVVGNALISMHSRCCDHSGVAEMVFAGMQQTDVITWTSMAATYSRCGQHKETLGMLRKMDVEGVKANFVTLVTMVEACSRFMDLEQGRLMHCRIRDGGFDLVVTVSNSLIHMYTKFRDLSSAIDVFGGMKDRNAVSWTSMMVAYTQNGCFSEAFKLFYGMELEGVKPDVVTLVAVVDACAGVMVSSKASEIHARVSGTGYLYHVLPLANSVITMHGRCGKVDDAVKLFASLRMRNEISWSSMIAAYAQNGLGNEAISLFELMVLEGVKPNESSFATVLSAYSHRGRVVDCCGCFASIAGDHGLEQTLEHYSVVVDLLGRVGMLARAEELLDTMPYVPHGDACLAMLSACVVHEDLEQGRDVSKRLFGLDSGRIHESPYILLSNVHNLRSKDP